MLSEPWVRGAIVLLLTIANSNGNDAAAAVMRCSSRMSLESLIALHLAAVDTVLPSLAAAAYLHVLKGTQ